MDILMTARNLEFRVMGPPSTAEAEQQSGQRPKRCSAAEAMTLSFLGREAGVAGLSCLLLAALLSVRALDSRLGGLSRLWKVHHLLGAAAFLLLMAHPLLLSFDAARVSLPAAARVLFPPFAETSAWMGWLALAVMAGFLAPTFRFFGRPEYQRWKALHALSGGAVVLGTAHAVASGSNGAAWLAFGGLAFGAFAWQGFAAPRLARRGCTVVRVEAIGTGIVELTLKPDGSPLSYRAGQFIYLTPLSAELEAGRGEEHPFTLSSAPAETRLRVVIKDLGDATRALQSAKTGMRALIEGPYGAFFPTPSSGAPELWISGGIGVTPFLSRARSLRGGPPVDIHMFYCAHDDSKAHFSGELAAVAANVPGFRLTRHFFSREGPLNAAFLAARCPNFAEREAFICGPPGLIAVARTVLSRAGASSGARSEDFNWL